MVRSWDQIVLSQYHSHAKVFSEEAAHRFPDSREWNHAIDLKPDAPPTLDCKVYPLSPREDEALQTFLSENLDKGYIRQSKSPYTFPFFFIKKKNGDLRPVQDYRKLNAVTVRNTAPLPLIRELMDQLTRVHGHRSALFTKLDIWWGYNNIHIRDSDQWKAAFKTNRGHFEPMVMFFGLTNAPATFQSMMNFIFRDLINEGYVLRVVVTHIAKSRSQGNRLGLRGFEVGYSPRIGIHKMRSGRVHLRLVLVQKRTRLEFLQCTAGCLYTWGVEKPSQRNAIQVQRGHVMAE